MALYPITVNTPVEALPHIYAEDDAAIYESISGGDGVYDIGEMLKATVLSNNNVRIGNGVLSVGGHIARIKYGDYEEMTIDNGESGKNRNDLIVARFSTTGFGGVDEFSLEVKKGVAVTGAAKDPEVETGNLYEGETIREFPLHRVRLEGISIVAVDQLFAVRKTNEQLQKEVDELNRKLPELVVASSSTISYTPDRDCKVLVTYEVCGWGFGGTTWQIEITGSASSGDSPIRADMKRGVFDGTDSIYKDVSTSAYFIGLRAGVTYTFNRVSYAGSGGKEANPFMKLLAV